MVKAAISRLARGGLIYGLGGVLQRFIGLLLLPLFTRELSPGEYGIIALISLLSIALAGIFNLGTGNSMGILYFRESAGSRRASIIWSTFALLTVNSMLIYGVAYLAAPQLSMWMFQTADHQELVRLGLLSLAFGTMAEPWLAYLRMEERGWQYVSVTIAVSLITAALSAWMLLVEHRGVSGFLAAGALGQAILLLLSWAAVGRRLPFGVDRTLFGPLVRIGVPSIWGLFAFMFIDYADRQMIERMLGLDALGIYSVGYSFGMVMMVAVGAFSSAWPPFFMSFVNRQHEAGPVFARVMTYYVLGFGALVLLFFLAAKPMAHMLTASAFHDAHLVVGLVAAAYALKGCYLIALPGVYFANKLLLQSLIEWSAALLNIGLTLWLLPRHGIVGGALATFLSYLSLPVLAGLVSRNYLAVDYEWRRIIPGMAVVALFCALGAWFSSAATLELADLVVVNLLIFAAFVVLTGTLLTTKSERAWMRAKLKV